MKKSIVYLVAGMVISPSFVHAQSMTERKAIYEKLEQERRDFQIYLTPAGEAIGINPQTKTKTIVKNYLGVFINQKLKKKITVQYMPETNLVASYFIEQDDTGNVFYVESLLNEHGVNFTKDIMSKKILEIINASQR